MEHETSTGHIILNVAIQLLNIALFFFVVIKFLAKPITQGIVDRMEKEKKLALADETYQHMIDDAEKKASTIIQDASAHKDNLVRQGEQTAKQKYADIVEDAHRKAQDITETANKQVAVMQADLEKNFTKAVQSTSREVVKKIFTDKKIEQAYVDTLVEEFTKSKK